MSNRFSLTAAILSWSVLTPTLATSGPAEVDEIKPIRVVFYNLKNYLAMDRRVKGVLTLDAPKPDREIAELINGIKTTNPDILAVCEMGDPDYLDDLQLRLMEAGIKLPHKELVRSKSGFDRNLALLSRFPIAARDSRDDYTYRIFDKKFPFQRGVLDTTIRVNDDYELRCIVLHFKSKREVPEAAQEKMRLNESYLARTHINDIFKQDPEVNLLVVGDLNEHRHEEPIKTIRGYSSSRGYLSILSLEDPYGFHWTHHWSYANAYSQFDYALLSRGIKAEVEKESSFIHHWPEWDKASDHRPIVITIHPENLPIK